MKIFNSLLFLCLFLTGLHTIMAQDSNTYLALGDSYTIGESVKSNNSWPQLLADKLNDRGVAIDVSKIIATTGWTTDELINAIEDDSSLVDIKYDLVSLLIGVNNQYRGYGIKQYEEEFELLLRKAIELAGKKAAKVFVLSIPDYGVTLFAKENDKNPELIAGELNEYNQIAKNISAEYGVSFFDITPISLKAYSDATYLAEDKLHPSAKMYEEWVDYIEVGVFRLLKGL